MSVAYRFDVQLMLSVLIEDDSINPQSMAESRVNVVDNLREYVDAAELSDCYISDGVKL